MSLYIISTIAALSGVLFGYDTGVIAGALPALKDAFALTRLQQEMLVGSVVAGAFFGALLSAWLVDYWGRRALLLIASVGFIVGTLMSITAMNLTILEVGRCIIGLSIGATSYATPLYIAEIAPAMKRGTLVLINAITISGSEALAIFIGYLLAPYNAWRWMFGLGLIPALILFIGMLYLRETSVWYQLKQTSRERLWHQHQRSWRSLFQKANHKALTAALMLGLFQQFFGINTVMYYGPTLFQSLGFHNASSLLITFAMGIINTLFSIVSFYLVDRVGRRFLLLLGSGLASISLFIVAYFAQLPTQPEALKWVAVLCFTCYIAGYCISVGSLFWLIIAEIFPLNVRAVGMSLATATQWGANFMVSVTFLDMMHFLGAPSVLMIYGVICVACFYFCYRFVPELTGVPLVNDHHEHRLYNNL